MIIPTSEIELVDVAPDRSVSPRQARQWIRGQRPLLSEDGPTCYTEISEDELEERYNRTIEPLLLKMSQSVADIVAAAGGNLDDEVRSRIADLNDAFDREIYRYQGNDE